MSRIALALVVLLALPPAVGRAQEAGASSEVDQLKAETDLITAQTNKVKAESEAENARRQIEIDRLKAQKDLLDSQNATEKAKRTDEIDKLKAQKDLIEAATPNVTGLPNGTVTFDEKTAQSIENTVMAYEALHAVATAIAPKIYTGRTDGTFVILGPGDKDAVTALSVFETQAAVIKARLKDLNDLPGKPPTKDILTLPAKGSEPSSVAALGLVGPAINAATALAALFKVDDKFAIRDETASARAIYSALAAQLQGHVGAIYYPDVLPVGLFAGPTGVQTTLNDVATALDQLRGTYFGRLADGEQAAKFAATSESVIATGKAAQKAAKELAVLQQELKDPATSAARKKALPALIDQKRMSIPADAVTNETLLNDEAKYLGALKAFQDANDKYIALIEAVLKAGDDYIATMTKTDTTTTAPLTSLIAAERLRKLYTSGDQAKTWALEFSVERMAGTRKEHTNFFGTRLSFSGGTVVSYRVFNVESGQLVAADAVSDSRPFTKVREH